MDEECSVALELGETESLISLLSDALSEAVEMRAKRDGKAEGIEKKNLMPA
jgi:hypothetical protein